MVWGLEYVVWHTFLCFFFWSIFAIFINIHNHYNGYAYIYLYICYLHENTYIYIYYIFKHFYYVYLLYVYFLCLWKDILHLYPPASFIIYVFMVNNLNFRLDLIYSCLNLIPDFALCLWWREIAWALEIICLVKKIACNLLLIKNDECSGKFQFLPCILMLKCFWLIAKNNDLMNIGIFFLVIFVLVNKYMLIKRVGKSLSVCRTYTRATS